jgi:hypothetical protein
MMISSPNIVARPFLQFLARQSPPQRLLALGDASHGVLGHYHCAVHDQAEVDRAQAHQIA